MQDFLAGYKTYIGVAITLISSLLAVFGKGVGIDWGGVEANLTAIIGGLVALIGYVYTKRGSDTPPSN
jgi:hypothetical protein